MDERDARARFAGARVARLATIRPDGAPHLVPVIFALDLDTAWLLVDRKPKRHRALQRLANIRSEPRVSLLVDRYEEDWGRLWWVRADGLARIVERGPELERAIALVLERYPQERELPPDGPAIAVAIERWRWWPDDGPRTSLAPPPEGGYHADEGRAPPDGPARPGNRGGAR